MTIEERQEYQRTRYREAHGIQVRPCGRVTGPRPRKYCYGCTLSGCHDASLLSELREKEIEYHRTRSREYWQEKHAPIRTVKPCGRIKNLTVREFCHKCDINDCEVWE